MDARDLFKGDRCSYRPLLAACQTFLVKKHAFYPLVISVVLKLLFFN